MTLSPECTDNRYNITTPDYMDFVVTYVDCDDPEWRQSYAKYKNIDELEKARFTTDPQSLRLFLRGVAKLDYIRKVFLVVASESQVPSYVNRDEVTVVLHSEFIPHEYLPTFNSNTIETFLHRIPGLADYFIYSNDDMFILDKIKKEQFLQEGNTFCKYYKYTFSAANKIRGLLEVAAELVFELPRSWNEEIGAVVQPQHIQRCFLKKAFEDCYLTYKDYADAHITRFRDQSNYTIFTVDFYQLKNGIVSDKQKIRWIRISDPKNLDTIFRYNPQVLCLGDEGSDIMSRSIPYLLKYNSLPCKYEK